MQRNTFAKATLSCPLGLRIQGRRLSLRQFGSHGSHAVRGCKPGRPSTTRRGRSLYAIKIVNETDEIANVGV